jgi:ribonuclease BN (tRNA processing enzyme)
VNDTGGPPTLPSMRLYVLGSNGTFATPGRPTSGYVVENEGTRVWIDAGSGTFAALQGLVDYRTIDAVVITHAHADHSIDLFGYYHAVKYGPGAGKGVPVYCPPGFEELFTDYLGGPGHEPGEALSFVTTKAGDSAQIGSINLRFVMTDHSVPTLGVRFEADRRVFFYSSDTGPEGSWMELAERADVFLCEATYQGASEEKPWKQHLTAREAGEIARTQMVDRLVITHIWPFLDPGRSTIEAEATFGRPVGLAAPGLAVTI